MKKPLDIRPYAVGVSIVISIWVIYQDSLINDDGILYLVCAELISQGDWQKSLAIYNWPFYSALISGINSLTGAGFEYSAYIINTLLQALIVYSFISVIKSAGADQKVQMAAALIILIYPNLNEYRSLIIRDYGFWAFYLLSILIFIHHLKNPGIMLAWAWSAVLFLAFLFRIEAVIFYLIMPLSYFMNRHLRRTTPSSEIALLYSPLAAICLCISLAWITAPETLSAILGSLDKPLEFSRDFVESISENLGDKATLLRDEFLIKYSNEYAWSIVIAALSIILITEILSAIGVFFTVLSFYAVYRQRIFPATGVINIWYTLIAINLIVLSLFVITKGFLVGRYTLAMTLTVMLAVPFGLVALYEDTSSSKGLFKLIRPLLVIVMAYMAIDGLISFGPSKAYIKEAAAWLQDHTRDDESVFSIETSLLYTAGKLSFDDYLSIRENRAADTKLSRGKDNLTTLKDSNWQQNDYLAVRIKRKRHDEEKSIMEITGKAPLKQFSNKHGDKVLIFKTGS